VKNINKPNKSLKLTANPLRLRLAVVGSLALTLSLKKLLGNSSSVEDL